MGLPLFSSYSTANVPGNPNPKNYIILFCEELGDFTYCEIQYPDCKNYEGIKILIFQGHVKEKVLSLKEIDPHFTEATLTPIARFSPSKNGRNMAKLFCYKPVFMGIKPF